MVTGHGTGDKRDPVVVTGLVAAWLHCGGDLVGIVEADALQNIIENAKAWPVWGSDLAGGLPAFSPNVYARAGMYDQSLRDIATWVALRESDRQALRRIIQWPNDREYRVDPLPSRIAGAYSDLLFGEDPDFTAASASDQDNMDEMVEANDLPSELRRWCEYSISEGEVWWRCWVDKDMSDWPIVDISSRLDAIPMYLGRRIAAVAFVEDLFTQAVTLEDQPMLEIWRHIEIQTDGLVRHLLYKGDTSSLGNPVPLAERPETAGLPEQWDHGLDVMLSGRIPNKLGRDFRLGVSEYQGVKDLLFDLNEAHSIMAENARNTAKARMVVPASAIDEDGNFDAGKDVVVAESLDESLEGRDKTGPYAVLEYQFQATPLLTYMDNLINTVLTRVGLAEQFVQGSKGGSQGQAFTGTALRTRLIPTTLAAAGKARFYDDGVPKMLLAMQQVSNLPVERGGTGQSWSKPTEKPEMKRSSVLPEDQNEETQRHVMAVQGEVESIETAVDAMHDDWSDEDKKAEVERIKKDREVAAPSPGDPNLPNKVPGGPNSKVPTPGDLTPEQPGAARGPDGQSPAGSPEVKAGGPR